MRKLVLTIALIILAILPMMAQNYTLKESPAFSEPRKGHLKLIQLQNNYTAYLYFDEPNSFEMKLYDDKHQFKGKKNHKLIMGTESTKHIKYSKYGVAPRVFSIDEDIIVFHITDNGESPVLNRFIYSGITGLLKDKQTIAELDECKAADSWDTGWGSGFGTHFFLRKEERTDHYVVGVMNSKHPDRENKGIKVLHFNDKHEVVNEVYFKSPNPEFKFMEIIDVTLIEDNKLIAMAYVFDKRGREYNYNVILGLGKDDKEFSIKKFDHPNVDRFSSGILKYNEKSKLLAFMGLNTLSSTSKLVEYVSYLNILSPTTLEPLFIKEISAPNVQDDYKRLFGPKAVFGGLPQDLLIDEDGNYIIYFEEMTVKTVKYESLTMLGTGVLVTYDDKTVEQEHYIIPKSQVVHGEYEPMYQARTNDFLQRIHVSNNYKRITFLNGKDSKYIFYNEIDRNIAGLESEKLKLTTIEGVGECDAYALKLKNGQVERAKLFSNAAPKTHNLCAFTVWDYNPATNTLATLKLEVGKEKKSKVVWIKL